MLFIIKNCYFNFLPFLFNSSNQEKHKNTNFYIFFTFLEITFLNNLLQKQCYLSVELYVSFKIKM